jgi:hypothetical protein
VVSIGDGMGELRWFDVLSSGQLGEFGFVRDSLVREVMKGDLFWG